MDLGLKRFKMKKLIDDQQDKWIKDNEAAGSNKDEVFKILLDENYDYDDIKEHMNYEPSVPLSELVNPFVKKENINCRVIDKSVIFIPGSERLQNDKIELYTVEQFLNEDECQLLIDLIRAQTKDIYKKNSVCDLSKIGSAEVKIIDKRICEMIGIDPTYSGPICGQYYQPHRHFAVNDADIPKYRFIIYLNEVEEGGSTFFPTLNLDITPKIGMAVIWNNLKEDGSTNKNAINRTRDIPKGYKAVITKSFYTNSSASPAPEMFNRDINQYIPNYTRVGFKKSRLPDSLFLKISKFYIDNMHNERVEFNETNHFIYNPKDTEAISSTMIDLTQELRDEIHSVMIAEMEEWTGQKLKPTYVYGIRIYKKGVILVPHRDNVNTHTFGIIINVDQIVNTDWLLEIDDNYYREHKIILKPGDIVFYEGGRLKHSRKIPFDGTCFSNIFCHFTVMDILPISF